MSRDVHDLGCTIPRSVTEAWSNGRNSIAFDQHIAQWKVADLGVHRQDGSPFQEHSIGRLPPSAGQHFGGLPVKHGSSLSAQDVTR
jgi:hypothetical protein